MNEILTENIKVSKHTYSEIKALSFFFDTNDDDTIQNLIESFHREIENDLERGEEESDDTQRIQENDEEL